MSSNQNKTRRLGAFSARLTRRAALQGAGAAGLAAALAAHGIRLAEASTGGWRQLDISAKDYGFELPDSIPAGYTEITLRNQSSEEHHAMFMRLHPGVTTKEFLGAAENEGPGALFALSSSAGGPGSVGRGEVSTVIVDLTPGEYVLICMVPDAHDMPHYKMGMMAPLAVTGVAGSGAGPTAETTVDLVDFSFDHLPGRVRAGKHVWKVMDSGTQLHEMVLYRLAAGVSFEQAKALLMAPPGSAPAAPAASAPFIAVAGVAPMSPGAVNWAVLDLKDGDYFANCYIPDTKTGKPHFDLGMIAPFTVAS